MRLVVLVVFLLSITAVDAALSYENLSSSPTSPQTYLSGRDYTFSSTWTPSSNISNIFLEHNFEGSVKNTTVSNVSLTKYEIVFGLGAGDYNYRWIGNDTSSVMNSTSSFTYTINKEIFPLVLKLAGNETNITISKGDSVVIEGSSTSHLDLSLIGDFNGTETLDSGEPVEYVLDTSNLNISKEYNVTLVGEGNSNYTSNSISRFIKIIDDESPEVFLNVTPDQIDPGESVTIEYNVTDNDELEVVILTITNPNGVVKSYTNHSGSINFTDTSTAGVYDVLITAEDVSNNTNSDGMTFNVGDVIENFTIAANQNKTITFTSGPVESLTITAFRDIEGRIKVNTISSPGVTPDGVVLNYFEIVPTGFNLSDISNIDIVFIITESWKTTNNITEGSISLMGLNETWRTITTTKTSETITQERYKSSSDRVYSKFAIIGERELPDVIEVPKEPTPEPKDVKGPIGWIITALIVIPLIIFSVAKRRMLMDLVKSISHTAELNVKRIKAPSKEKLTKKLSTLQDKMYKLSTKEDMGDAKIHIDQAAIALQNDDLEAAEFYLYEAEKLIKKKNKIF